MHDRSNMVIGIWVGFSYEVSIEREGVGRYIVSLARSLSANPGNSFEIWCYEENKAEILSLFKNVKNCRVFTDCHHFSRVPRSLSQSASVGFSRCLDILLRNQPISWRSPAAKFKKIQKRFSVGAVFLYLALLLFGFASRSLRKFLPKSFALEPREILDDLADLANKHSRADIFLIPLVTLENAAQLVRKKLVAMHDLATLVYEDLFRQDSPHAGHILHYAKKAVCTWDQAQDVAFVSNSEHVRETHVLKYLQSANRKNSFRIYLPVIIDADLVEGSWDSTVLERLQIKGSYIFYPTQIRPHKNINCLIRAWMKLKETRYPELRLVLTGRIEDCLTTDKLVKDFGLENEIDQVGSVSAQDLMALYRFAAVAAVPTLFEGGLPWQALEAMSVDTPVVMSNIPAVQERLKSLNRDDAELCLFDPDNWEDLATKIEYALANRPKLVEKQRPIKDLLLKYTWEDAAVQYQKLLAQVVTDPVTVGRNYVRETQETQIPLH